MIVKEKKIKLYLNRTILGKIIKFSNKVIRKSNTLMVYYFYWLYQEVHNFITKGFCVRKRRKSGINIYSLNFTLFFSIKNVKVNQVYINTSPFITFYKKHKKQSKKLIKSIHII